jgi:hypothetical protein
VNPVSLPTFMIGEANSNGVGINLGRTLNRRDSYNCKVDGVDDVTMAYPNGTTFWSILNWRHSLFKSKKFSFP